jgi:ferritin
MISDKMAKGITEQINFETYSAYLYMAISAQCQAKGLKGAAKWFFVQTQEELTHALRFYNYLNNQGRHVALGAIDQPPLKFDTVKAMFEAALEHEKKVTGRINKLASLAADEKDYATGVLLQWFVKEQVEEEQAAVEILQTLDLIGEKGGSMYMLDRQLGKREFKTPADA